MRFLFGSHFEGSRNGPFHSKESINLNMLPFTTDWVILKKLDKNNLRTCIAIEQVTEAMISGKLKEFVGSKICCYLCDDGIVLGETLDLDGSLVFWSSSPIVLLQHQHYATRLS